ncbi:MAG: hypothetical protein ACKN9E_03075, partial [Microcystaceae cyanobacterium]
MKDHYDFSASVRNAYFKDLQEFVTVKTTIMMKLNQKQLDILQAIQKGCRSDHEVSNYLNFEIALVRHYLDEMERHRYVYVEDYSDFGGSHKLVSLADKGIVAINYPDDLILEEQSNMNNINFNAPINAPIGILQNSDGNTINITQNNNQNIQEIINSLEFLEKEIQVFPE